MADILTVTLVVPLFAGLWPFVTTKGCLAGMFSGILFIMIWGWVEYGTFMAGMEMITLMCFGNTEVAPKGYSPYACGPWYAWRSPIMFTMIPLTTLVVTYGLSWMERMWEMTTKIYSKLGQVSGDAEADAGSNPTKSNPAIVVVSA